MLRVTPFTFATLLFNSYSSLAPKTFAERLECASNKKVIVVYQFYIVFSLSLIIKEKEGFM